MKMKRVSLLCLMGLSMALVSCQSNKDTAGIDEPIIELPPDAVPPWVNGSEIASNSTVPEYLTETPEQSSYDEPVINTPKVNTTSGGKKQGTAKKTGTVKKQPAKPAVYKYTVKKGDVLERIARKSGTTVSQIMKDSKLKNDKIYPGDVIYVRYKGDAPSSGKSSTSSKTKTKSVTHASTMNYTVKRGESIESIAKKMGSTPKAIRLASGLSSKAQVKRGQTVQIPK